MSHPIPGHAYGENEYPADGFSHYPHPKGKKGAQKSKGLHNVANSLSAKARALKKAMSENGGRHGNVKRVDATTKSFARHFEKRTGQRIDNRHEK